MRNDIIFKHGHYSTGETPKDALNERNDKTWNQGLALYLHRVKEGFDLPGYRQTEVEIEKGITTLKGETEKGDVFNLCFEAQHHVQWLRKALQV